MGNRNDPPPPHDERLPPGRIGADQLVGQAETVAEIDAPRDVCNETVGPLFDEKTAAPLGPKRSPQAVARLEERQLDRRVQLDQSMRRRQPSNAPANYGDSSRRRGEGHRSV